MPDNNKKPQIKEHVKKRHAFMKAIANYIFKENSTEREIDALRRLSGEWKSTDIYPELAVSEELKKAMDDANRRRYTSYL